MSKSQWNDFEYDIVTTSSTLSVKFNASQNRFFLDEVKLVKPGFAPSIPSVTIAASGYGTYCCQYPLDFSETDENYKAWYVSSVDGTTVTFTRVMGKVSGGVPVILYGEPGTYDLTVADASTNKLSGNMLVGTLAPTWVEQVNGDYTNFALSASNGDFRKIPTAGMTFPANKVYLPVLTSVFASAPASRMAIMFNDETTGISTIEQAAMGLDNAVYDLQGRRVEHPQRGGLYLMNGRKFVAK